MNTCASEFVELYVGSGALKVRKIFEEARNNRPAIIFIDELESIGSQRPNDQLSYSMHMETYSTLNQLLAEIDGVYDNDNIVVIAATNRVELLDEALIRPGRFDFKLHLAPPDADSRYKIFKLYLSKFNNTNVLDDYIWELVEATKGYSGANIEAIVNDAATFMMSKGRESIEIEDLEYAKQKNFNDFKRFKNL